ncbi:Hypothetical Protein FCC1311_046082 [Hondaea fermentalgiana]|uniref:Uncharacterized protein n=1 Tax=Hondaea fermentalgiana TaxID=2315210 RepID=A0A2R5GCT7_9STRA|nr:Hypothetical Protein FCC1311_046082 [Hondaea fermentalgiana]|eukprot:GBG28385.1 Hypothetical Protein FCC1311_046082 [Hondaea fermentalgiana]
MKSKTSSSSAASVALAATAAVASALAVSVVLVRLRSKASRRKRARRDARQLAAHEVVVVCDGDAGFEVVRELRARLELLHENQAQKALVKVVLVNEAPQTPWLWRLLWAGDAAPDTVLVGQVASVYCDGLVLSSGRTVDFDALVCASTTPTCPSSRAYPASTVQTLCTSLCSYLGALEMEAIKADATLGADSFPAEWHQSNQRGLEVEPGSFRVKATPHVFAMGVHANIPAHGLWPTDPIVQAQAVASGVLASLLAAD